MDGAHGISLRPYQPNPSDAHVRVVAGIESSKLGLL